jgi:serine/threonine-protein kinase RsbW
MTFGRPGFGSRIFDHALMGGWIEIESSLDRVEETVEEILGHMDSHALANEKLFGLRLALQEAIGNAILHGNRNHPDLPVCIRFVRTKRRIKVIVRDEGEGFDPGSVPDPTEGDNLFLASGRGIYLMRKLVDHVHYNKRGNEVTLVVDVS